MLPEGVAGLYIFGLGQPRGGAGPLITAGAPLGRNPTHPFGAPAFPIKQPAIEKGEGDVKPRGPDDRVYLLLGAVRKMYDITIKTHDVGLRCHFSMPYKVQKLRIYNRMVFEKIVVRF